MRIRPLRFGEFDSKQRHGRVRIRITVVLFKRLRRAKEAFSMFISLSDPVFNVIMRSSMANDNHFRKI